MARRGRMKGVGVVRGKRTRHSVTFKANARGHLKNKQALVKQGLMPVPDGYEMRKDICGCVGTIQPGTIIRLNTVRRNAFGKLFFFDAFAMDPNKNLRWIGEFDLLSIDDLATALGEEVTEFNDVHVPDEEGLLKEVSGDMIVEGGVEHVPEIEPKKPKRSPNPSG